MEFVRNVPSSINDRELFSRLKICRNACYVADIATVSCGWGSCIWLTEVYMWGEKAVNQIKYTMDLPRQFWWSDDNLYPVWQSHVKLPTVFKHRPFWQIPINVRHSSISIEKKKYYNSQQFISGVHSKDLKLRDYKKTEKTINKKTFIFFIFIIV